MRRSAKSQSVARPDHIAGVRVDRLGGIPLRPQGHESGRGQPDHGHQGAHHAGDLVCPVQSDGRDQGEQSDQDGARQHRQSQEKQPPPAQPSVPRHVLMVGIDADRRGPAERSLPLGGPALHCQYTLRRTVLRAPQVRRKHAVSVTTISQPATTSPFAPFRHRVFFWLWLGVVVSSIGVWGQTVGAQWLFVNDPNAATIVPLVQTASTLPMMLLALPAGVLADAFDRRWLLFVVQLYGVAVAALLAVLTALDMMPPALLLAFTFAVGAGLAMTSPTWQALITELVPRSEFAAATRLDMVSVNVSRAAGPALAGFVIAAWGVAPVFALNAAVTLVFAAILLAWRRPTQTTAERERFLPAMRAGSRYVRHEPVVRTLLLRFASFIFPATAVWALLPLIARQQLGLAADGYGILFAGLGVGAVAAALSLGAIKQKLSSNAVLALAGTAFTVAFAGVALTASMWVAIPLLLVCGFAWTATVATVISELQLFLPGWVRARAIAIYLMVFLGTQSVASPVWGLVTAYLSLRTSFFKIGKKYILIRGASTICPAFITQNIIVFIG